jgi:hypothetical protein
MPSDMSVPWQWRMELWARNGRQILPSFGEFHTTWKVLLHATNLQHDTDAFTSPLKEGTQKIFWPWKIPRLRPGLNPRSWVPEASRLTTRPPKSLFITVYKTACHLTLSWVSPSLSIQFNIHFNIIFPSMPMSSELPISQRFPNQTPVHTSLYPKVPQTPPITFFSGYITQKIFCEENKSQNSSIM